MNCTCVWRVVLLLSAAMLASAAIAQTSGPGRFAPASSHGAVRVSKLPPGLDTTPVVVVVILAGDPVATVQESAGRKLTRGEKDGVKGQRKGEQDAIRSQIEAAGGKIVGTFQSAVNGIKVQIPANKVGALNQITGVVDVKGVNTYRRENVVGVPRVQAPAVWGGIPGFRGEGIKIAIIDTGIDYTHADFGGPGTPAAFDAEFARSTLPPNPLLVGPLAPKVKGGIDLSGDDYNADDPASIPVPDSNPLDCNGHGTHVAGTAAGFGVRDSDGSTFHGPYDQTTYATAFRVGPGVAPKADLYAVRVFGCGGSTNLVVEALDWAVDNGMDVVNMSLGSDFGTPDSADALASDNAVRAGIVVVSAAGNAGDLRYVTGSPAASTRSISVAATETIASVPSYNLALPAAGGDPARVIVALNSNAATASPVTGTVKVLRDGFGDVSLGCDPGDYVGVAGMVVVVNRGVCARVSKAFYGWNAGATAVVMINNSEGLPPFDGPIDYDPDTGEPLPGGAISMPFLGVRGTTGVPSSDGSLLVLRDGMTVTFAAGAVLPAGIASFSSSGPRNLDSALKPEISAPGSPIFSAGIGSGTESFGLLGTSQATPHVAGIAALVQQAHPDWKPGQVKAAIVNSGDPDLIGGYVTRRAGTGFVNANAAARTKVIAYSDAKLTSMSFGLEEFGKDYSKDKSITLRNDGNADATFNVSAQLPQGSPHTISLDRSQIRVRAHDEAQVTVTLRIPASTAGNSDAFRDVAGLVTFTPAKASDNGGIALRVPYYLVPRISSNVNASLDKPVKAASPSGNINLTNKRSPIAATADFYSWGLAGAGKGSGKKNKGINLSAAGVQAFPFSPTDQFIVFAVTTEEAWSAPSTREFDVLIDVDGDGKPDYAVVAIDLGFLTTGFLFDGNIAAAVFNLATGDGAIDFLAYAPTDSSTILIPVLSSRLGLSAATPRFSYTAVGYDFLHTGASDAFTGWAKYNPFSSAITDGQYAILPPDGSAAIPFSVNTAELALTPALGLMVVTQDNKNGSDEANLVKIDLKR